MPEREQQMAAVGEEAVSGGASAPTMQTVKKMTHIEHVRRAAYPIVAGVPTAALILYFLDFGQVYKDVVYNLVSPIITGIVSGAVLYVLGLRRY